MKKNYLLFAILFGAFVFFSGCTKEELIVDPAERVVGTWKVESITVWGITAPGEGATITFDACGETGCEGSDYVSGDDANYPFTYTLTETNLTIEYPDQNTVGDFSGDWTIDSFTNSTLNLSMDTFLGAMSYKLKK